ncbi:hypothetical protein JCM8097_007951 [Rhodosporidiobolus ruineniae]
MLGLLQGATRALRTATRPCTCRAPSALPQARLFSSSISSPLRPSTAPASTSTSPILRLLQSQPRPAFAPAPLAPQPPAALGQVRTFKMPACVRKKKSAVARNGGAGKTARKNGARRAKRRRQRINKIN